MQITIPASIEDAKTSLNGLERLMQAKQWERAAIVYAFTDPGEQGDNMHTKRAENLPLTIKGFARLGLTGLRYPEQVRAYRKAWQEAIDLGKAVEVKPGDAVTLPDLTWKDHFGESTKSVQERVTASTLAGGMDDFIAKNPDLAKQVATRVMASKPEIVVEAVKSVPAVVEEIAKDRNLSGEITTRAFQIATNSPRHVTPAIVRDPQKEADDAFWKRVDAAIETVSDGMQADSKGTHGKMPGHVLMGLKMMIIAGLQQYDPDAYKDLQAVLAARTSGN